MSENLSLPAKWESGDLVFWREVAEVINRRQLDGVIQYELLFADKQKLKWFDEADLRDLTRGEFWWHIDPRKGHRMIGKNRVGFLYYGLPIGLLCAYFGPKAGASSWLWAAACSLPLIGLLAILIRGTIRNRKGKQA